MKKLNKKGFTLIELIVVIAILAILAAILIPSLTGYLDKANQAKNLANARAGYSELMLQNATVPDTKPALATSYTNAPNSCVAVITGTTAPYTVTSVKCGTGTTAQTFTP